MIQTAATPPRRPSVRKGVRKDAQKLKCTIILSAETSLRLTVAAHLRGLDRSELVNELLTESLRHIVISLRATSNGSVASAAEISPEVAAA